MASSLQDILAPVLSSEDSAWIVVETKLLKFYLTQEFATAFPQLSVLTRGDLYRSLPFIDPSSKCSDSSLTERCFKHIIEEDFPILSEEIVADGAAGLSFTFRALAPIVEFVEGYLCYDDHTDVYSALVDQFGGIKGESERLAELVRLADLISVSGGALALDLPASVSESDKHRLQSALPQQLLFYLPTNFVPLERHFLSSISKLTTITFLTDRSLIADSVESAPTRAPSERFLTAVQSFIEECCRSGAAAEIDIGGEHTGFPNLTAILDGVSFNRSKGDLSHVSVVEIEGEEPSLVVELVTGLLNSGRTLPSDLVVVALDENCGGGVCRLLRERGVVVVEPRGRAITETPYPGLFRAYVEWLIEPSMISFENFYLSPQIRSSFELRATLGLIRASALDLKIFDRDIRGISDEIRAELAAVNELAGTPVREDVLNEGLNRIDEELRSADRSITAVRKKFHALRYRLKQLVSRESELDKNIAVSALHTFSRIVRREAAALSTHDASSHAAESVLRAYEQRVRAAAAATYLNQEIEPSAVIVTQLLDARSLRGKTVIVMSAVETNFFGTRATVGESISTSMDLRLKRSIGAELPGAEALAILRSLLQNSRELFFTFSKSQGKPPRFVERLSVFSNRDTTKLDTLIRSTVAPQQLSKGARLLLARNAPKFTEFDGLIGFEALALRAFEQRYSVTDIQNLSECAHKFFFGKLLELSGIHGSQRGLISRITGTLTHRLLKRRFSGQGKVDGFLSEYQLPWDLPEYRQMQQLILSLYLPTAERLSERLGSSPILFETDFRGDKALVIESVQRSIAITGAIDRVDLIEDHGDRKLVTIWDYKTSPLSSLRKRNALKELQVPLYALALNDMGPYEVVGGGLLLLNFPGLDEEDFESIDKGPIRDQLRLKKDKGRWVIDPGSIADKLETVTQTVKILAEKVGSGQLHQNSETDSEVCHNCDFQRSCARDEVVLEQKEQSLPISVSSIPLTATNIYRLYFNRHAVPEERTPSSPQQQAGQTGGSFVVHAGAGAGKTATIVHRVVSLLLAGNPISSVVTVTFTKKAAAELKERLKLTLSGALERRTLFGRELNDSEIAALSEAFYGVEKAQIGTIHSFCHGVLSTSPNTSRDFYRAEIFDESGLAEVIDRTVSDVIAELSAAELSALFASRYKLYELKGGIRDLLVKPTKLAELKSTYFAPESESTVLINRLVSYHGATVRAAAEQLIEFVQQWIANVEPWIIAVGDLKEEQRRHFEALIGLAKQLGETSKQEGVPTQFCDAYAELLDFAELNDGSQKRVSTKNPINFWKVLRDELREFDDRILATDSLLKAEQDLFAQSRSIVALAAKAADRFQRFKVENGFASFDDIINAVHSFFVSDNPQLLLLHRTTKHVLIDEFQDTDAVQWEIFKRLNAETMFIVGDYQQAIYGFRGGELSVFEIAEREITDSGGKVIVLDDNYRSMPAVINFVNGFFNDLFSSDGANVAVTARAMQPVRKTADEDLEGAFVINAASSDQIKEANNTAALVVAVLERKPGAEVAVIARTSKQIRMLCGGLTRANIPYVVLHSGDFYDREEIKLFHNLFSWLGQPENDIALVGVLRSALFGFSDDELLKIFSNSEAGWPKEGALTTLQHLARSYSAVELIEYALNQLDLAQSYTQVGDTTALSNLSLLRSQLTEAAKSGLNIFCPLAVARWLERKPSISKDAVSSARGDGQVKILTIHGAKGLEFSNVVLPFLDRRSKRPHDFVIGKFEGATLLGLKVADDDAEVRTKTMTQRLLDEQNTLQERAEERRVFYVACTRARDTLIMNSPFNEERESAEVALAACARSFNPVTWIKQLVEPGEVVSLTDDIELRRAIPISLG